MLSSVLTTLYQTLTSHPTPSWLLPRSNSRRSAHCTSRAKSALSIGFTPHRHTFSEKMLRASINAGTENIGSVRLIVFFFRYRQQAWREVSTPLPPDVDYQSMIKKLRFHNSIRCSYRYRRRSWLLLWISDPVKPCFSAITSWRLDWLASTFGMSRFSSSANFCQYGLVTKNRNLRYLSLSRNVKIWSVAPSTRVEASL